MSIIQPRTPSDIILLAANVLPLAGVMLWGWKVFDIMLLYWIENIVIGVFNILKMLTLMSRRKLWLAIPIVPFFTVHYGMFCAGHGAFIILLFGLRPKDGDVIEWAQVDQLISSLLSEPMFLLALASLVLSHAFSFFYNYLGICNAQNKGEIEDAKLPALMHAPYGRIMILHITIILGGGAAMAAGEPVWALMLLTLFKTIADLRAHQRSHKKTQTPAEAVRQVKREQAAAMGLPPEQQP